MADRVVDYWFAAQAGIGRGCDGGRDLLGVAIQLDRLTAWPIGGT